MKTLVLLIAVFAFADQILHVRSKTCDVTTDCYGITDGSVTAECLPTKKCKCADKKVPNKDGCGDTLATPVITAASTDIKVGEQLELTCTSESQTDGMSYKWKRGDTPVEIEGKTDKTLKIEKVTLKDAGKYICTTTTDVQITTNHIDSKAKEVKITAKNGVAQVAGSVLVVMAALVTSKLF